MFVALGIEKWQVFVSKIMILELPFFDHPKNISLSRMNQLHRVALFTQHKVLVFPMLVHCVPVSHSSAFHNVKYNYLMHLWVNNRYFFMMKKIADILGT